MKRLLSLHIILISLIFFFSNCATISNSKVKHQSHFIKLKNLESDNWLQVNNEEVKILYNLSNVLASIKKDELNNDIIEFLDKNDNSFHFENNIQLKDKNELYIFHIAWNLLKTGNAKVFDKKTDTFVKEIEFVKVNDINGEQEYFRILGGDIFLSKIISLGE